MLHAAVILYFTGGQFNQKQQLGLGMNYGHTWGKVLGTRSLVYYWFCIALK